MSDNKEQSFPRWVMGAVIVPVVVALIGAGIFVANRDGVGEGTSTTTATPAIAVPPAKGGAEVRACMAQHQMSRARTTVRTVVPSRSAQSPEVAAEGEPEDESTIFKRCDWPPPAWADPDGYSEIAVVATSGPIPYEASDASRADLIKSNCSVLRVSYSYVGMGNQKSEPPITSKPDNSHLLVRRREVARRRAAFPL